MGTIRKAVFWAHLAIGLLAGIVIFSMSVTGVLMVYERQITEWVDGVEVVGTGDRLALEPLLQKYFQGKNPPSAIQLSGGMNEPVGLQFGREMTVFLDPYSGESLGVGKTSAKRFFRWILGWHRWLGQEGASKPVGKAIIGVGNLMFLFLVVSGLWLWFPRRWTRLGLKAITRIQFRLKGRARDWNWHNVFGFWACVPLFLIVVTGTIMAYPWANALIFRAVGEVAPEGGGHPTRAGEWKGQRGGGGAGTASLAGLDAAFDEVAKSSPGWKTMQIQFRPKRQAAFTVSDSHRGRPDRRKQVTMDLATGTVVRTEVFSDQSKGRQIRGWVRWIHTGEAGGWAGQTVAGLAAASAAVLVWTGFSLSWRRFFIRRKSKKV